MSKILISFLLLVIINLFFLFDTIDASTCKKTSHPKPHKPKVVLVHGFTGGGWSWFKVRYILESFGYNVTAIDLKASGLDPTDVSEIKTFEHYNEPLDRFMANLPHHEKVVLVGHSAGGVSLTKTILDYPHKVKVAVYVSATMIKSGFSTCEDLQIGVPHFIESTCNAMCPKLPDHTCFEKLIEGSKQVPLILQTEEFVLAKSLARPGPYRAIVTSNFIEAAKKSSGCVDKVPRVYVKTLFDQTLKPEQQDAMIERWPPCEVHEIDNDHDVPFAKPVILSALIVNATYYV